MEHLDILKQVVYPYINFALFIGLMVYVARKPLGQMVAKKKADFEAAVAEAQKARVEAESLNRKLTERMAGLEVEIEELKKRLLDSTKQEASNIMHNAERAAEHMVGEAKRIAETELEEAKVELKTLIASQLRLSLEAELGKTLTDTKKQDFSKAQTSKISGVAGVGVMQ